MSFPDALARLDTEALAALLRARPDVLVEPVPRNLTELAHRLDGVESLSAALTAANRDMVVVAQAVALHGTATVAAVADLIGSSGALVDTAVDELCGRGLAWRDGDRVALPERLVEHLASAVTVFRPVAAIARQALADDLRAAVRALGGAVDGLRKPELTARLAELAADPAAVARAVAGLSPRAREWFEMVRLGPYRTASWSRNVHDEALLRAGLLVPVYGYGELPREVAVSAWAIGRVALTGPPSLPAATPAPREAATAAVEELLRGMTALLDEAGAAGIAALKKGGVGARERARLAKALAATADDVGLWIDLAAAAGLLAPVDARYAPTAGYDPWREAPPGERWAALGRAWWGLEFAPTCRALDDGTDVPPPLPLASGAGMLRRALLTAAAGGRSATAAGEAVDWYCPLHGHDELARGDAVEAALTEAAALGVLAGDALSELGDQLVTGGDDLGRRCAALLPRARGLLVLQSDLTAVVSGQPSAAAARVLAAAAVAESRGAAATWRFTPASVRAALDAGWTADALRAELTAVSGRELPQPLDYLLADVARRHGSVRVRGVRACVVGGEPEIAEILHTRSLARLRLARLAPTVLASPLDLDDVLAALRAAGFAPLAEDAGGTVIVEERPERRAGTASRGTRPRADPAELARRLLAAPVAAPVPESTTHAVLAELTPQLDPAELALLADAVDHGREVSILYRDKQGNRTRREIRPSQLYGRWIDAWCHLRGGRRDFTVANIEGVSPAG
ncbi:MAG TPA: helicase-associated domain-containing protein [Pseudonocardia sp.]|nr:helicase-associated domain-containing protein [Pseudonocardia sp.]